MTYVRITKFRLMTAAEWAASVQVLHTWEAGLESDTGKAKRGDGLSVYSSLSYLPGFGGGGGGGMVYPGAGIAVSDGVGWIASVPDSSANWDTAYSWGDHALAGYVIKGNNLSDLLNVVTARQNLFPSYAGNTGKFLKVNAGETDVEWAALAGGGDMLSSNNLSDVTNPVTALSNLGITGTDISNWDAAFGWGNHALVGYLTSFTETDPVFTTWYNSGIPTLTAINSSGSTSQIDLSGLDILLKPDASGNLKILDGSSGFKAYLSTSLLSVDQTFSFPDATGTFALTSDLSGFITSESDPNYTAWYNSGDPTLSSIVGAGGGIIDLLTDVKIQPLNGNYFWLTNGSGGSSAKLDVTALTADRKFSFPDAAGTIALTSDLSAYLSASTSSLQDGYFGSIYLWDVQGGTNYLQVFVNDGLTATRTLQINVGNTNRSLIINGNVTALSGSHQGTSSGTNTGDQTSIVGISGTKSQFDTACSDGNFLYVGDITQYTDELAQDAIGAMVTDGSLVYVDATPLLTRAALTGAIIASQGSNTTALGSFTKAQLDTAISDGNGVYNGDVITSLTGTKAQFNTACSDGDFVYVGDSATSAAILTTSRNIGGVAFNGSADIVPQTIQSVNEATDTTCFPLFISASGSQSLQPLNNAGFIYNSNTNNLTATTFTGALSGNATTATSAATLTNSRLINGTSFNGSANITLTLLPNSASTSNTVTFTSADYGTVFLWSPSGTATATLPANGAAAGSWFDVLLLTAQTITISSATVDTLITLNDTQADSVAFSTAGSKIGALVRFISNGSFWVAINLSNHTMTIAT